VKTLSETLVQIQASPLTYGEVV